MFQRRAGVSGEQPLGVLRASHEKEALDAPDERRALWGGRGLAALVGAVLVRPALGGVYLKHALHLAADDVEHLGLPRGAAAPQMVDGVEHAHQKGCPEPSAEAALCLGRTPPVPR